MAGSTPASLSASPSGGAPAARKAQGFSPWQEAWRRFRRHKMALFSAFALALILFGVLAGPFIWRVPINEIDFAAKLQGPSWNHPLGTDDLGQDLLSRLIYGGRISIAVGFAAMVVAIFFGVLVGAIAGMSSGRVDAALMWVTDLFLSLPQLPLLLLVIYLFREPVKGVLGVEGGAFVLIVAVIGGTRWMSAARLVRAQFLSLREKEFVEAARAMGDSTASIIFRTILPNIIAPLTVIASFNVASVILAEASLSFLGLGVPPEVPTWGSMLAQSRDQLIANKWWLAIFPGIAIVVTVLSFNIMGDWLRDFLDPRMKERG